MGYNTIDNATVSGIAAGVAQVTQEYIAQQTAALEPIEVTEDTIQSLSRLGVNLT